MTHEELIAESRNRTAISGQDTAAERARKEKVAREERKAIPQEERLTHRQRWAKAKEHVEWWMNWATKEMGQDVEERIGPGPVRVNRYEQVAQVIDVTWVEACWAWCNATRGALNPNRRPTRKSIAYVFEQADHDLCLSRFMCLEKKRREDFLRMVEEGYGRPRMEIRGEATGFQVGADVAQEVDSKHAVARTYAEDLAKHQEVIGV